MTSFIVTAHKEELGSTRKAMITLAEPYEVIAVDDASTDATQGGNFYASTFTQTRRKNPNQGRHRGYRRRYFAH
jgi:hypothetical protein